MAKKEPPSLGSFVDDKMVEEESNVYPMKTYEQPLPRKQERSQEPMHERPQEDSPPRMILTEPPRTDMPRQTFYVPVGMMRRIKVYAAVDAKGVSEIVREALEVWLNKRDREGIRYDR